MVEKEEKKQSNTAIKAVAGTLIILVLVMVLFFIGDVLFSFKDVDSRGEFKTLLLNYAIVYMVLSFAMLFLSVYLTYIYLKDYLELKSKFTLGILLAVVSFMIFAISSNPLLHQLIGIYGKTATFTLIPPLFATISLAILAWISSK